MEEDGDGGGGHTADPFTSGPPSGPLAPDLGTRVLMGCPSSPTWILAVSSGPGLDGEFSTEKILTGSSSPLSSSALPSLPSLVSVMKTS
jgi:hypothetical protein